MSPDLPTEIWVRIFAPCAPNDITLVCKRWTNIAYDLPTLWTRIRITSSQCTDGCLAFLNDRLRRARGHPLDIEICIKSNVNPTVIRSICAAIAAQSAAKSLQISVVTVRFAGQLFKDIALRNPSTPHTLQRLSLKVDADNDRRRANDDPYPSWLLARGGDLLPALRSLTLTNVEACLPFISSTSSNFDHLTTLVIYAAFPDFAPSISATCSILHHTPQLQTLWFKSQAVDSFQAFSLEEIEPDFVSNPVFLPQLISIAVTATGGGGHLLGRIEAPVLRDLHLDSSRTVLLSAEWPDEFEGSPSVLLAGKWSVDFEDHLSFALQRVALHSAGLRRLAFTETSLPEKVWRWILSGDPLEGDLVRNNPGNVPFPELESLSIRDFSQTRACGLTDAVLSRYAVATGVIPRRLVLRRCESISGMVLLHAARIIQQRDALELEIVACPNVNEEQVEIMRSIGVRVNWEADRGDLAAESRVAEQEWWGYNRVFLQGARELMPEEWERVISRDEYPWWIFDSRPFDPTDDWVY